ncbi:unnamed protein product [Symbiodinium necroappetens]|uniref:Uncharacterized protein n=1 Tax=Symbiodinium necroappetens TaxID=1628268 RepID=A0A813A331_9DINO|nr:unnamed protein product [Symbiodinium necroappetens]
MEGEPKLPPSWAASIGLGAADAAKNELKAVRQQLEEALAQNKVLRAKADNSRGVDDATRERDAWRRRAEKAEKKVEALTKRRPLPKNAAHARLLRRLKRNIAREMRDAEQGFVINKVTEKHGKTEVRRVAVCPQMLVLKWCHAHEAFGSTSKWLDLRTVKKVEYGPKARASKLFPEVSPWLCFSLVTADRSYDFITSNDSSARCFVLSISRLCEGFAEGIFKTRGEFESAKGWHKLKTGTQRRGLTLSQVFTEALQQRAFQLPPAEIVEDAFEPDLPDHGTAEAQPKPMDLFDFCDESPTSVKQSAPAMVAQPSLKSNLPTTTTFAPAFARTLSNWMSAPTAPGAAACQGTLPKPGENWVFTGAVDRVDLYRDPGGAEWVNEMTCRGPNNDRRMVTILSMLPQQRMVEIRGTDKLKFVKGWARLLDDNGAWLIEQAPK